MSAVAAAGDTQKRQKRTIRRPRTFDEDSDDGAPAGSGPTIRGVTWAIQSKVTAQDSEGQWYSARMIAIDEANKKALIHFDRWNKRYDEWIPFGSARVRPKQSTNVASESTTGKRSRGLKAQAVIEAGRTATGGITRSARLTAASEASQPPSQSTTKKRRTGRSAESAAEPPARGRPPLDPSKTKTTKSVEKVESKRGRKPHLKNPAAQPTSVELETQLRYSGGGGNIAGTANHRGLRASNYGDGVLGVAGQLGRNSQAFVEEEEAVTLCVCGFTDESDYMIQCEQCNCWQHGDCVGLDEASCPDRYICFNCMKNQSKVERSMSRAIWTAKMSKNPRSLSTIPVLPKEAIDSTWTRKDTRTKHLLATKESSDRERHRMLAELQANMASDLALLEQCIRAIRLRMNERHTFQSSSMSAKARMENLLAKQVTIEAFIQSILKDSDMLESATAVFITADQRKQGISLDASNSTPNDQLGYDRAILTLRQLYKKYDERTLNAEVQNLYSGIPIQS